jgi:Protein of unknown function (DUF3551)
MRKAMFALAAVAAVFAIDAVPTTAQAYPVYPWCGYYGGRSGVSNCYFANLWQCQQAVSGTGGTCSPNPFYGASGYGGTSVAPRRAYRHRRHYRRHYRRY